MPRKSPDLDFDFNIFVDPSCLSAPMDEETSLPQNIQDIPVAAAPAEKKTTDVDETQECNEMRWKDIHLGPSRGPNRPQSAMDASTVEDTIDDLLDEIQDDHDRYDGDEESVHEDGHDDVNTASGDEATEKSFIGGDHSEDLAISEPDDDARFDAHDDEVKNDTTHSDGLYEETNHDTHEGEAHEDEYHEEVSVHTADSYNEDHTHHVVPDEGSTLDGGIEGDGGHHDDASVHEATLQEEESTHYEPPTCEDEPSPVDESDKDDEHMYEEGTDRHEDDSVVDEADLKDRSRRTSTHSDRRGSLRTEALIQAAARAVVAKIEERAIAAVHSHRNSLAQADVGDLSVLSSASHNEDDQTHNHIEATADDSQTSRRQSSNSSGSQVHHQPAASVSGDEAGDSSSHHEAEDDVFSDRSARSSLGSFDGAPGVDEDTVKTPVRRNEHSRSNSPRLSGVSSLSQYEKDEFVPTTSRSRDTPRMPFRTPSDVRAIQMSSPTPSVFNGSSPRSGKRNGLSGGGGLPTVSRLGSPTVSAQYSPKGRSTPPRFKMRKEAPPLVLLHVTLLPLRWVWGGVVDGLDAAAGKGGLGSGKDVFAPSDELKALRDAWRQLQDRVGDTVLERGILLPHPQNDYEVLEERLLEALELPLRRRARILECGHYLGPANEMADDEESECENEYSLQTRRFQRGDHRHWCNTCKGEIKYEDLGPGKVFRVKVYASNGLMKAGAWAACWKEMERVDVEVEPIVDTALHRELERLSAFQVEQEERHQRELEDEERARHEEDMHAQEEVHLPTVPHPASYDDHDRHPDILSSPLPPAIHASPPSPLQPSSPIPIARSPSPLLHEPIDTSEARRRRDEARLREIYGMSPPPAPQFDHLTDPVPSSMHPEPPTSSFPTDVGAEPATGHTASSYAPPPSPRSPSEEAHERRTQRRTGAYQGASLPELVLEAVKVLLRDRKNMVIAVLGVFVLLLAMRLGNGADVGGYRVAPVLRDQMVMDVARGRLGKEEAYRFETVVARSVDEVPVVTLSNTVEPVVADQTSAGAAPASLGPEPEVNTVADALPQVQMSSSGDSSSANAAVSASPEETLTEKKVVRVVETITETVKVSVTATESVIASQESKTLVETGMKAQTTVEAAVKPEAGQITSSTGFKLAMCPVKADVCAA
ncbi:hypothetical protein CONLIGDRAFT_633980 [Coniochaeta ligniaria NRRL 30616]|uniref:Pathway-specific nitrogen regulator n=1 Tax=Coniochaeta ligniaria NRRL 30616 TaxID=1408157 RepID=A0A1J7IIU3_9PEZI|nr:hypothetical protein CONLIGDRAFT_633980 [Coniochaeta ligniaria NRRL 30616]